MSTGKFIVFEGPNFSGKSSLLASLADHLRAGGREVVTTREPGGTAFGEAIRPILKNPATKAGTFATALAFNAARKEHADAVISPALARGAVVLCDRYYPSTEIFQCVLSSDLTERERSLLCQIHETFIQPDLTVFLLPTHAVLLDRVIKANRAAQENGYADRFEGSPDELNAYVDYASLYAVEHPTLVICPSQVGGFEDLMPQLLSKPAIASLTGRVPCPA